MPRHNNVYIYDGKKFSSHKQLSEYSGVNEKTITARLQRGMSIESACEKRKYNEKYFPDQEGEKSIAQLCREHGKSEWLVRGRLQKNYSINQALNCPKKITKQGQPTLVNGILYNSIAEAIRKLHLEHKEGTIRSRLRAGWSNDDAFCFDKNKGSVSKRTCPKRDREEEEKHGTISSKSKLFR